MKKHVGLSPGLITKGLSFEATIWIPKPQLAVSVLGPAEPGPAVCSPPCFCRVLAATVAPGSGLCGMNGDHPSLCF